MTTDAAVTAAAEALANHLTASGDNLALAGILPTARAVVTACRPLIEKDIRERIAADIGAMTLRQIGMGVSLFDAARDQAARIARGQS